MTKKNSPYQKEVEILFKDAPIKKYPKNQIIFYQGDELRQICYIKSGYVKAYTILDTGDTRTIFLLGPGDVFPIAFSLTLDWENYNIRYFYQTLKETHVQVLDQALFKEMIDNDIHKKNAYLSYMSASNAAIMQQLEIMKNKGAINKVALLLPYLIDVAGENITGNKYRLAIKLSHQEIADLSGLTRETTTHHLKKLENNGVIIQKRDTWIIHTEIDPETNTVG